MQRVLVCNEVFGLTMDKNAIVAVVDVVVKIRIITALGNMYKSFSVF